MALSSSRKTLILISLFFGGLLLIGAFAHSAYKSFSRLMRDSTSDFESFQGKDGDIAVVEIRGVIQDSTEIVKSLNDLKDKGRVKAVVIRIDSPGGSVAPSQEIYSAVAALKSDKKVVCSLGDLAASGGYYIAVGCEKIVANPGTLTGSIGVIMQFMNIKGLYTWAKLEPFVLKAGKYKDVGSPLRAMSEEERQLLQGMLDDVHAQFKKAVREGRGLEADFVEQYADGRIFSGQQAQKLGFVDQLGGEQDAIHLAQELAGLSGKPKIIREDFRKDRLTRFLESQNLFQGHAGALKELLSSWMPQIELRPGVPYLLASHIFAPGTRFFSSGGSR